MDIKKTCLCCRISFAPPIPAIHYPSTQFYLFILPYTLSNFPHLSTLLFPIFIHLHPFPFHFLHRTTCICIPDYPSLYPSTSISYPPSLPPSILTFLPPFSILQHIFISLITPPSVLLPLVPHPPILPTPPTHTNTLSLLEDSLGSGVRRPRTSEVPGASLQD